MIVSRSHKIALQPTPEQEQALRRAAGVARFTWNWALTEWKAWHKAGKKPTAMKLKKHFNAVKRERFPWVYDSPRDANAQPFANLGQAFRNFFDGQAKYPKLKKKGKCRDAFYVANDKFRVDGTRRLQPMVPRRFLWQGRFRCSQGRRSGRHNASRSSAMPGIRRTRYDRCAHTFYSAICIAATVIFWL